MRMFNLESKYCGRLLVSLHFQLLPIQILILMDPVTAPIAAFWSKYSYESRALEILSPHNFQPQSLLTAHLFP